MTYHGLHELTQYWVEQGSNDELLESLESSKQDPLPPFSKDGAEDATVEEKML